MINARRIFAGKQIIARMLLFAAAFAILTGAAGRADTVGRQFPLYVADYSGNAVLKIDSNGNITQFAQIQGPASIAVAPNGDVYVTTEVYRISCTAALYRLDSAGNATLLPNIVKPLRLLSTTMAIYMRPCWTNPWSGWIPAATRFRFGTGWLAAMAFGPDSHLYATVQPRNISNG